MQYDLAIHLNWFQNLFPLYRKRVILKKKTFFPQVRTRGFTDFDKDPFLEHELDIFLPLPGSSVVPLHEVTFLLETGAFTRDTIDEDDISEDLPTFVGNESDIESEVEETETRLSESKSSFTSSVEYPFTFCEVAFLIHKLYQCANRRFKLRDRRNPIESIEDKTEEEEG